MKYYNKYDDLEFTFDKISTDTPLLYQHQTGDSLVYVGQTHYHKTTDDFDTLYLDTIVIHKYIDNAFTFTIKEIKYKWLQPLPGQVLSDIMIWPFRDTFKLINENYSVKYIGNKENNWKISVILRGSDSIDIQDDENSDNRKILAIHTFRGKILKR
jgi:hypothetical protein